MFFFPFSIKKKGKNKYWEIKCIRINFVSEIKFADENARKYLKPKTPIQIEFCSGFMQLTTK